MTDRRSFLKKSGALVAITLASAAGVKAGTLPGIQPSRIIPKRLKKGDLIALVTPGSPVTEEQLARSWSVPAK